MASERPSLPKGVYKKDYLKWQYAVSDEVYIHIETPYTGVNCGKYYLTPLGRLYRNDGRLLLPSCSANPRNFGAYKVNLHGGKYCRSLPKLMHEIFGCYTKDTCVDYKGKRVKAHAWVDPDGPIDELTGRLRHSVFDVVLVPHGEILKYHRGIIDSVKTRIPILPPDTPNTLDN